MGEFFKGWKRKTGCVTLLMACVFMGGWVKSFDADYLVGFMQHSLNSINGGLIFERPAKQSSIQSNEFLFLSRNLKKYKFLAAPFEGPTPDDKWRRQWAGFVVAEYEVAVTLANGTVLLETNRFYRVPYWSITIPLTLISLWLLVSKPRKLNQKKISEPIPEKVA